MLNKGIVQWSQLKNTTSFLCKQGLCPPHCVHNLITTFTAWSLGPYHRKSSSMDAMFAFWLAFQMCNNVTFCTNLSLSTNKSTAHMDLFLRNSEVQQSNKLSMVKASKRKRDGCSFLPHSRVINQHLIIANGLVLTRHHSIVLC